MGIYTIGVDIGSSSSKAVILKNGKEIIFTEVAQMGIGSSGSRNILNIILENSKMKRDNIDKIVVTGYGRFTFEEADKQISEISCHAKGIKFLIPDAKTIIDIGGQDAKAISLDQNGSIKQFFMNDKCAAGTGRFITVMSRILEIPLEEMELYDDRSIEAAKISSTCTVFAESEVISQLAKGTTVEDIIAGVHNSVAHKVGGLAHRTQLEDKIVMCGGVAKNYGVVRALKETLKKDITVAPNPQTTGALGAAIYAYEEVLKK
ncbi:MAG: acyl-CoA dehydratase activase [Fusobacteriaceae bacterium]|jgi:predicted CoA-substrate-specific enzyme activase|nr:acyl-CoA dehydratase activase [Fusobacteriaceae bacterium]